MIGILGGTFDPVHSGHLLIAETLAAFACFAEIKFIPCKIPVHKNKAIATTAQRLKMLQLAIAGKPKLSIDRREIKRKTPSFMIETLRNLRKEFPDVPLVLIIGMDNFLSLSTWHEWKLLLNYAHILVVSRPNVELHWPQELEEFFKAKIVTEINELSKHKAGHLYFHAMDSLNISATEIRELIKNGKKSQECLPKAVWNYIMIEKLYIDLC